MSFQSSIPADYLPLQLEIAIGGCFNGPCYKAILQNGELRYTTHQYDTAGVGVHPDVEAWRRFRTELDRLQVWDWLPSYENFDIVDGKWWGVEISYKDRQIRSAGNNAYPGSDGPEISTEFECFLAAIRNLLGGREFV